MNQERLDAARLRPFYSSFLQPGRLLLTGHSHQAWPDVAREGLLEAFTLAAAHVDDKWDAVFAAQSELRAHIATRIGAQADEIAFAPNTHELVARFLSALPLAKRPHVVTTTGEFHSAFRQLKRLAEEGVSVTFVDALPAATLTERLAAAVTERTSAVLASTVLFETSSVVHGASELVDRAERLGARVLLDAYHAFDVVPFTVPERAFLVAGGYKYAQWGEGVCFLRVPSGSDLRPVYTGWFAGFADLANRRTDGAVAYAADGATRFAGSTFDPTSTLRARAVARFFEEQGMTPEALRATSLAQTARILAAARELPRVSIATPVEDADRGGFVALRTPEAGALSKALRADGVFTDARGEMLRFGPAPYLLDDEIDEALARLRARL
ncbi:MAG: aminotransferase class V-fold PLP-dependent enzyme [Labilithrix sp.]|nr:aminotransferase class V-fold PLP-dependent enzyme [Labilithrix sp.]MCW5817912.1 aminotransferase class V-fold PLP-dependent enzyme [Labilithrix sp.]